MGKVGDRGFDRLMKQKGFTVGDEFLAQDYRISWPPGEFPPDTMTLKVFLDANRGVIQRISLRRESPHLQIHAGIKPLLALSPDAFFEDLQAWLSSLGNQ